MSQEEHTPQVVIPTSLGQINEVIQKLAPVIQEQCAPKPEPVKNWTSFQVGHVLLLNGVALRVHDVSPQRLVLKFV